MPESRDKYMQKSQLIFTKRTHSSRSRVFSTLKRENSFSVLEKEMVGDFFFFFFDWRR